ncbi:MAG: GIY-YIG nuclease family protein [Candidatus Peribacteria bacterium]|nr:MAG: GIY-YIG nuclease family protein [Candidatus Peribacteria bacterium]
MIYIGKSVHLKNRVSSYFNGKSKLNFAKKKMVEQICDIKTIITNSETESLLLENTLIKKHQPKYNILLKDDKNYSYIKITDEVIPRVITTRK